MVPIRVADVALDHRTGGAEAIFTYLADEGLAKGDAVFVPLGPRSELGFVTRVYEATESELGFPVAQLRRINGRVEGLSLPAEVVDLCDFVAQETLTPLPVALTVAVPPGVRDRLVTSWNVVDTEPKTPLTPLQQELLRVMREQGGFLTEHKGSRLAAVTTKALKLLRGKGLVTQTLRLNPVGERRSVEPMLRLTPDEERVENFLKKEGRRRPAQALTVMRLQGSTQAHLTASEIRALAAVTETTVKALLSAGILESVEDHAPTITPPPSPNPAQRLAIDAVVEAIHARRSEDFLLFGVTGSGKTEVYLRAASEALRAGRQVLFVVPEIALAAQTLARLRERFGRGVAVLHSELPPAERLNNWMRVRTGQASVVLGARSALFAPLDRLGLVIVDEEHESSYKQESAPRYHAKSVAKFLGKRHQCPVVLGSATPSVESFLEAEAGEIGSGHGLTLLTLPERAASARLPEVLVHDLTLGYKSGRPSLLCPELEVAISETLERGEQVILFLNRRAYAPFVICRDCGFQMTCPQCAISLSYHRKDHKLRCHHCGYQTQPATNCPNCLGGRLNTFGVGTEKVEDTVIELFPQTKVARLDRDVARKKGALEETLAEFRAGNIGILVGTQMVAKGLDFPNVTLVGAIAADVSLNIPDFRASERTFQLLAQVAGRAGRGQRPGRVFIQTFNPTHPAIRSAEKHDFLGMLDSLRTERQQAGYPPYRRLVNIVVSGEDRSAVMRSTDEIAQGLRPVYRDLLGPVDCPVERLHNRWRRHILIKLTPDESLEGLQKLAPNWNLPGVTTVVDVDPYTLM